MCGYRIQVQSCADDPTVEPTEARRVRALLGLPDEDPVDVVDSGWTSRVYVVGRGAVVFKFPRRDEVKDEYRHEEAVLRQLEGEDLGVRLPRIRWTHPGRDYLGYEGIVGEPLDVVAPSLSEEAQRSIGRLVGRFLKRLHSLSLRGVPNVSVDDEIEQVQHKYELGSPVLKETITSSEQTALRRLILEETPNELRRLGSDEALCHGDLGYWNIIMSDDDTIGVIDFGDIGFYDKSKDFAGIEHHSMLREALAVYGDDELLRAKIALRRRIIPILDLPFFLGKGDDAGIRNTVARIRANLAAICPRSAEEMATTRPAS
jgi:aminoglycoside phosphotransferase